MTGLRQTHRVAKQARLPAANEKTSKRRRIGRATLGALAAALLLGAAPQEGRAQACKAKGISPETGCVTSTDIKNDKDGNPVINQKWRKDEAGVAFNRPPVGNKRVEVINGSFTDLPVFTTVSMKVPAPGWIVVTANAVIEGVVTEPRFEVHGVVDCEFQLSGPLFNVQIPVGQDFFFGAVNTQKGFPIDTMQNLYVRELGERLFIGKKPKDLVLSVDLACGFVFAGGIATNALPPQVDKQILMRPPSLVIRYFPTRHCPKKKDGTCR